LNVFHTPLDRPKQVVKSISFPWDNAPSHAAKVAIAKISELGINQMRDPPYSPYSPDIARRDFFLFGYLKHRLQRCSSGSADEFFSAITDLMENLENLFPHRAPMRVSCVFVLL
jgi:hypothetical protein